MNIPTYSDCTITAKNITFAELIMKHFLTLCLTLFLSGPMLLAQGVTLSGRVVEKATGEPVEFATVVLTATEQWSITDEEGRFTINNIAVSKSTVNVSCLGYATFTRDFVFTRDIKSCKFELSVDNLTLSGAVVTAKENDASATTSRTVDKTALEHVQLMNVGDISSLLPGGVTVDNNLVSSKQFNIRAGSSGESGNASFGTAVEVDGVRLSNNASFEDASSGGVSVKGVNTNNIASSNVESVEVITGVPSVEYGDIGSGIVKINTKKGKTPWMATLSTSPNTKQVSVSKGFGLKGNLGIINASLEYTRSIAQAMSPYTAYDRKQASLSYSRLFNGGIFSSTPLRMTVGITGNLGGMNTQADPDAVQGTWSQGKDNALRANFNLNWLLNKPWITHLELAGSISYSDKSTQERTYNSAAVNKVVLHGKEAGYYIAVPYSEPTPPVSYINPGYWYNIMGTDDRPLTSRLTLKAGWSKHIGKTHNMLKAGIDWSTDHNFGKGLYSPEMETAPTFREYPYYQIPVMHNMAAYIEDNLMIPLGEGRLNLIAGLRSDNTYIKGSSYGLTSSLSPRFNGKYAILEPRGRQNKVLRELSVRASWGIAVKLPSFSVLFPTPTYRDDEVFASKTNSANQSFAAYRIEPRSIEYNPGLRWQRTRLCEVGADADILGTKISLAAFWNRSMDAYMLAASYANHPYTYTPNENLDRLGIPVDDQQFTIDPVSGIVTVSDKNGVLPSQELPHQRWRSLSLSYTPSNENSAADRYGIEWVVDFTPIRAINTNIRLDGTWYAYHYLSSNLIAYSPTTYRSAQDSQPFGYVGYYYGDNSTSNGSKSRTLRTNLTISTQFPSIRMILSAKLEASLVRYSRALSETLQGEELARVISNTADVLSTTGESIYSGDHFVVLYPQYYSTADDPTLRDYLKDLVAARDAHNEKLFTDLSALSYKTSYLYTFVEDRISPYFSANFSVTKEFGDFASISFYANNFFNNRAQVWSSKTRTYTSASNYIPRFYYGLTLRLKF